MTMALPAISALLLAVAFCLALGCYTLRDFSRSRLEDICRRNGREQRFSEILKVHEDALLAAEVFQATAWIGLIVAVCAWRLPALRESANFSGSLAAELAVILPVTWLCGVLLPWTLARVAGEPFLFWWWPFLRVLLIVAGPVVALLRWLDAGLHKMAGRALPEAVVADAITEEIRTVVDEGQREGVLQSEAGTMIQRVMHLHDVDVADIMTPRTAMICIEADASLDAARKVLLEAGHSRIPVIGKTTDDIVGMLYAKDLLQHLEAKSGSEAPLKEIARSPIYVPETMGIDTLLKTFKKDRVHLAIVLDEYGGVAGLVTLEDILEEIVGEIIDEYDFAASDMIHTVAAGVIEVNARAHVDDVNEQLGLKIPDGDYDTLGGFVFSLLGRIPATGEQFEWEQVKFTVLEADKRKLVRLRLELDQPAPATAGAEQAQASSAG